MIPRKQQSYHTPLIPASGPPLTHLHQVVTDESGASKGYGYVHFETGEAAADAISKFDGTLIDDMEVRVSHFLKRGERAGKSSCPASVIGGSSIIAR